MKKILAIATPMALVAIITGVFFASTNVADAKELGTTAHSSHRHCGCHHHHHAHYWHCGDNCYYCCGHE